MTTQVFVILFMALTLASCANNQAVTQQATLKPNTPKTSTPKQSTQAIGSHAAQFMAKVKQQPNIQTTSSGLAYRVLKTGYGCKPTADSAITIFYQAQVAHTQKIVDSSYMRGKPDTYPLNRMIKAWREALPMMAEGSSWELYVPPHLAYGKRGAGADIPPNSAMIFKVELLKAGTCAHSFHRG